MARLARILGLGGVAALGLGTLLVTPAQAQTPTPSLSVAAFGITCTNSETNHSIVLTIDLGTPATASTDISAVSVTVNGTALPDVSFSPDPLAVGARTSSATVTATGEQINSLAAQATITPAGGSATTLNLPDGLTAPKCANAGGATSSTSSTSSSSTSSSSTSSSSTTATTAGSTTSTSAGATTTSTSTTLGPNDTTGNLTLSLSTVAPGQSVSFSGTGFAPNADVTLSLFSDPVALGTVKANGAGAVAGTVVIPATTATGSHHIEARGTNAAGNGVNLLKANLNVKAASGSIARTGGSTDWLAPFGIAVVSLGVLLFAWRERRLSLR